MAKFVFQLDGVLRHRTYIERERQRELAAVQKQMTDLQAELRTLNDGAQAAIADLRQNRLTGKLDLNFLSAHRRFMAAMQRQGMELVQRMALLQRKVDEARAALAEAAKQRKVIEKLRERQQERWQAEQNRKEMAELDEIGMQLSYQAAAQGAQEARDEAEQQEAEQ